MPHKERRARSYYELQQQIESECARRRDYWDPLVATELSAIPSIVWYIQAELIRTEQVPNGTTVRDMNACQDLKDVLRRRAAYVFAKVMRTKRTSRFIVKGTPNKEIRDKLGYIYTYDERRRAFKCYLDTPKGAGWQHGQLCYLAPEYLQPVHPTNKNRPRQKDPQNCKVLIDNINSLAISKAEVLFRQDLFQMISRLWKHPESMGADPYAFLVARVTEEDTIEEDHHRHLNQCAEDFEQRIESLKQGAVRESKRPRLHKSLLTTTSKEQVSAVLQSKTERCKQLIREQAINNGHMFTMPFTTTDKSLHEAGVGLNELEFNSPQAASGFEESTMVNRLGSSPIVVNGVSTDLIHPHKCVDESVIDLSLKW